jgi:uncharacterized protein (TIGR02391 family)
MGRWAQQPQLRQANLSLQDKRAAITKIDRRIAEIDAFDVTSIEDRSDPRIAALSTKLDTFLLSIFGSDTVEYDRYHGLVTDLDTASLDMMYGTPIDEVRDGLRHGLSTAKAQLETIKSGFLEDFEDLEESKEDVNAGGANALRGLHSVIVKKCSALYEANQYAEAVEKSFKVVRDRLRDLTGHERGSEAFGKGGLYISGATAAHVEKDFNDAVKYLTMAIDMFRNEKSHTSDAKIEDPVRAHHYLTLSSLAMYQEIEQRWQKEICTLRDRGVKQHTLDRQCDRGRREPQC